MPNRTYVVIGHGSRVPEAVSQFRNLIEALSRHLVRPITDCFLQFADPDVPTGLRRAAESVGEGGEVVVLPMVLGAGGHQKNDIADALRWARKTFPRTTWRYGTPLGPHAKLVALLDLRVNETLGAASDSDSPEQPHVLVVGHGSSAPEGNSAVAATAYLLSERRPYRSVEYAFHARARPDVTEGVHRCAKLGASKLVVAPYVLFEGKVRRSIGQAASKAGAEAGIRVLCAKPLGVHRLLLEVVAQRLEEASNGTAAMVCDVCPYRWQTGDRDHQQGRQERSRDRCEEST